MGHTQRKKRDVTSANGYSDCLKVSSAAFVLSLSLIFSECFLRNFGFAMVNAAQGAIQQRRGISTM